MADPSFAAARHVDALTDVALDGLPMTSVDRVEADLLAEPFPCWCDGDRSCPNDSDEGEYGLCDQCRRYGHRPLPALPFSLAEGQ